MSNHQLHKVFEILEEFEEKCEYEHPFFWSRFSEDFIKVKDKITKLYK